MLVKSVHLTYCLNVHLGESWAENLEAIKAYALRVKHSIATNINFGLGLRLGFRAANELLEGDNLLDFKQFLHENNLYVFTINGFPYGEFHGKVIKADVYKPDWSDVRRLKYTISLARILAELLPDNCVGSISTMPLTYKEWGVSGRCLQRGCENLARCVYELHRIFMRTGKLIMLAVEPEPDCYPETVDESIMFFHKTLPGFALPWLKKWWGVCEDTGQGILAKYLGICFDTAHVAVEFEKLIPALRKYTNAGIRIVKCQISSALQCQGSGESLTYLSDFVESVYLHQTKVQKADKQIISFPDLDVALKNCLVGKENIWRIHFHVPLFWQGDQYLQSTNQQLPKVLKFLLANKICPHFEIETYTFAVLPENLRQGGITGSIVSEYEWVLSIING